MNPAGFILSSLMALLGAGATYFLIHKRRVPPIRASSGLTVVVSGFFFLLGPEFYFFAAVFFGATFVGMTDPTRLGYRGVLMTSQLFVLIYFFISSFALELGGSLGASAFLSCFFVYEIAKRLRTSFISS